MPNLASYSTILGYLIDDGFNKEYQTITNFTSKMIKKIKYIKNDNVITKPLIKDMSVNTIIENINKIPLKLSYNSKETYANRVLYGLMMLNVRRLECKTLKICDYSVKGEKDRGQYNILQVDNEMNPIKLIYYDYKTAKVFDTQNFDIPDAIKPVLIQHIKFDKLKLGDYVFHLERSNKEPMDNNFSARVTNILKIVYPDSNLTAVDIRKSLSSYLQNKDLSVNQRTEIAKNMGHSFMTHLSYAQFK